MNGFAALAAGLKPRANALVAETIVAVRDSAKAHSRVDTGEMRDGWTADQTSDTHGTVSNDVPHTVFNEYGTVKMTAQPMLHPAMDEARATFDAKLKGLLE
jgi:HK97 gp10 family phage protein